MSKDNGGQAFPTHPILYSSADQADAQGMALLDYFAGQALAGMMARHAAGQGAVEWQTNMAWDAYSVARAMLAERAKAGGA